MRGGVCVGTLKCEVIDLYWLSAYPCCVRWYLCGFVPSLCERLYLVERGVVYSRLYCPKSSVEVPCVGVLCGQVSKLEILLCEGGDVELCARTSKHIAVFAFDPLTLTLSLSLLFCALHHFILLIHYMLGLFVCASLVLNHESFI